MSNSVGLSVIIGSIEMLITGISDLNLALDDVRTAEAAVREMENCRGERVKVDYIIKNEVGDRIGVRQTQEGLVEFVTKEEEKPSVRATIDRATQAYSRLKIIDEVKRKGYKNVKEERLANGSIRLVVEKWQ